ncbi:MAG: hypothetical protein ACF8XB_16385 [Planctomycetota bacterium JB042]
MTDRSRPIRREEGNLLLLVVLLIVPLASLGGAMLTLGNRNLVEQDAAKSRAIALMNAESGLDAALAQLLANPNDLEPVTATVDGSEALRYRVTFEDLGEDAADNDGDGDVDEEDERQFVRLVSRGSVNVTGYDGNGDPISTPGSRSYVKQVRAMGRALAGLPQFPYAVYLGDPNAEVQLNGNSFVIDGHDTNPDGTAGGEAAVAGISTTGDAAEIVDQLSAQQLDNVVGEGGDASVANVPGIDLQHYIDLYKGAADISFAESTHHTGDLGNYDESDFKITHAVGTLKISGGAQGAGLLLVEGNLVISGSWDYVGVVIVTGQVIFRGGGGGKRIFGTCLVEGDVFEAYHNDSEDLELSGTVDIIYSTAAQSAVGDAVKDFTLFGWQEL